MTIKAPNWCENAVPTLNGWEDPDTGELYVSGGFTQEQIDEFHGVKPKKVLKEVPKPKNNFKKTAQVLTEAPIGNKSLEEMTKVELEALGRQHGIELDRRKHKQTLIEEVSEVIDN